jgi:hypothetical protein
MYWHSSSGPLRSLVLLSLPPSRPGLPGTVGLEVTQSRSEVVQARLGRTTASAVGATGLDTSPGASADAGTPLLCARYYAASVLPIVGRCLGSQVRVARFKGWFQVGEPTRGDCSWGRGAAGGAAERGITNSNFDWRAQPSDNSWLGNRVPTSAPTGAGVE